MTVGKAPTKHKTIRQNTNRERRLPTVVGKASHTPVITASRPPNYKVISF